MSLHISPPLYLSFLRPLSLPRSSTLHRFLSSQTEIAPESSTSSTESYHPLGSTAPRTSPRVQPYRITRTPSRELPVYQTSKRGGTLKQTCIKKVEGDGDALRRQLMGHLGLGEKEVLINALTKHIWVKGHRILPIKTFLQDNGF